MKQRRLGNLYTMGILACLCLVSTVVKAVNVFDRGIYQTTHHSVNLTANSVGKIAIWSTWAEETPHRSRVEFLEYGQSSLAKFNHSFYVERDSPIAMSDSGVAIATDLRGNSVFVDQANGIFDVVPSAVSFNDTAYSNFGTHAVFVPGKKDLAVTAQAEKKNGKLTGSLFLVFNRPRTRYIDTVKLTDAWLHRNRMGRGLFVTTKGVVILDGVGNKEGTDTHLFFYTFTDEPTQLAKLKIPGKDCLIQYEADDGTVIAMCDDTVHLVDPIGIHRWGLQVKGAFQVSPIPKSNLIAVFDEEKVTLLTPEGKIEREIRWPMDSASKIYPYSVLSVMEDGTFIGVSRNLDTGRKKVIAMDSDGVERGHFDFGYRGEMGHGLSNEVRRMTFRSSVGESTATPGGNVYVAHFAEGSRRELHFFDSKANHLYELRSGGGHNFGLPVVIRNPSSGLEGLIGIPASAYSGTGESAYVQFLGFK